MDGDGTAYAAALTVRRLLRLLESKGVLHASETRLLLGAVSDELRDLEAKGAISLQASADASRAVAMIFAPLAQSPTGEPAAIAAEDLNASNDE